MGCQSACREIWGCGKDGRRLDGISLEVANSGSKQRLGVVWGCHGDARKSAWSNHLSRSSTRPPPSTVRPLARHGTIRRSIDGQTEIGQSVLKSLELLRRTEEREEKEKCTKTNSMTMTNNPLTPWPRATFLYPHPPHRLNTVFHH